MAHELDTRLQRHVTQAYYAPEDDDDPLLLLEEELSQSALADDDLDAKTPNWWVEELMSITFVVFVTYMTYRDTDTGAGANSEHHPTGLAFYASKNV